MEQFKKATLEKLRDVRCPEHYQGPRVRFQGTSLLDITVSLSGCCPKVMEIANARIGGLRTQERTGAAQKLNGNAPEYGVSLGGRSVAE